MFTVRDILLLLLGAQIFHTLSHVIFYFSNILPITLFSITLTPQLNLWAIVINAITVAVLLWLVME